MNDLVNIIEEDILATLPSLEEAERRHAAYLVKLNAGLLVEGVDYGFPLDIDKDLLGE